MVSAKFIGEVFIGAYMRPQHLDLLIIRAFKY
jgi:hypothetical protein